MLMFGLLIVETWNRKVIVLQILLLLVLSVAAEKQKVTRPQKEKQKICIGTNGRMSVPSNREHHYRNLRDRYTNCTYVDGNLELTWLQDETLDLNFLQYIREVTGYVLISHVDVSKIVLPRLQIIRGRTLLKLNIAPEEYALMVALSKMQSLELPGLRDILSGSVGFYNNYNLCHIKTINWEEILTGPNATNTYVFNFTALERECPPCHPRCEAGCWGEGAENCQKFSKINCSPQCFQGRCFGSQPRQCCHLFCAGGCTGPKQTDCLACRNVYDDGVCAQECPPMQTYNPTTYSWEKNLNGKYAYGATCVRNCPEHLLKDNGACVKSCPENKKAVNGECIPCEGVCPKSCKGVASLHDSNVDLFKDCTVIEGSITILETTFKGFQHVYDNYTIGPMIPPMPPHKLEVLNTVKEVTGFLNIQGYHENFTSLSYLRNLEIIGGRELTTPYFSSLYIVKTSLKYLGLISLKKIHSGGVSILENEHLCYLDIDWKRIKKSTEHLTMLQNNKKNETCQRDGEVCDSECKDGCWGPGANLCVSCAHLQYNDECVSNCDVVPGLHRANSTHCLPCHKECESVCNGPGPENCKLCRHVRDGIACVPFCPLLKYNSSGECKACHSNCVNGCHGPENSIGSNGCVSCNKAITYGNVVEQCLRANETCPDGYYAEWLGPNESGSLKPLSGKEVCRRCHPQCKKCKGYGFSEPLCLECVHYKRGYACEEECRGEFYADNSIHECRPCNSECLGCYGPSSTECFNCRNLKVHLVGDSSPYSNNTIFNCTAICPPEFPHKAILEENSKPYCSAEPPGVAMSTAPYQSMALPVYAVVGVVVMSLLFIILYMWKKQLKEKEENEVVKMSMIMSNVDDDHPNGDVQPNMSKLRICTENYIRKGVELGSGAFGRVYQGMLLPEEGHKSKPTPVAIKVLKEGTNPEKNKQTLEEAYIMASIHHQYLLKLIGVCMTSEMMLITPLMPLGCILDYLQKNKMNIGSKMMLTWCQQIAEGMAYLEGRKLIHRDLAARNVLLGSHLNVKISDFGLARLLDIDEEEYKADGSKVPVKWLALECIKDKIFSHKSDVWAYGVTIWELMTYGEKPYSNRKHTEIAELLEKGHRLPHPRIATIEVYKTMLSCWYLSPESRPTFQELVDAFKKMVPYSQRYLLIMRERLPDFDEEKNINSCIENDNTLVDSEEYLQPSCSNLGIPLTDFSQNPLNWDEDILQLTAAYSNHFQCNDNSTSDDMMSGDSSNKQIKFCNKKLDLPVDDNDYLVPSPQRSQSLSTTVASVAYMDLISDAKSSDENQNTRTNSAKNFNINFVPSRPYVCNLEYDMVSNDQKLGIPQVHQLQRRSSEEESDHEYYNDFDRLQRELQPLRRNRNETPV